AISGSTGGDTVHVFKPSAADVEIDSAGGSVKAMGIHELDLNLDGGADTVTIDNLQSSSVVLAHIDLGSSDHRADSAPANGGSGDDRFTLSGNDPATGIEIVHSIAGSSWNGEIYVQNTSFDDGDSLTIDAGDGKDTIDASSLGSSSTSSTTAFPVDLVALTIRG